MLKKILCILVLLLSLTCVLISCDDDETQNGADNAPHAHEFKEWHTTANATCSSDGIRERYCSCGEKQTTAIPAGHNIQNGICVNCGYVSSQNGGANNPGSSSNSQKVSELIAVANTLGVSVLRLFSSPLYYRKDA